MDNNREVILNIGADTSGIMSELDLLGSKINEVLNDDGKVKTFDELEERISHITELTALMKQHGLDGTREFTALNDKVKELGTYANAVNKEFGNLSSKTFNDVSDGTKSIIADTEVLRGKIDELLNESGESKTFIEIKEQMQKIAAFTKEMKKNGLDGSREYESLKTKFKELNGYAQAINEEFGALSNNTFENLSHQAASAAVETENFAHSVNLIGQEVNTSNDGMNKMHSLLEFSDRVTSVQGLGNSFSTLADLIGYSAQGLSEYGSASNQSRTASERARQAIDDYNAAVSAGQDASQLFTRAQQAQATATQASTQATQSFKTALISIGLGIILLLLDKLIENWDKVKESLDKVLPIGKKVGDIFDKLREIMYGVGNAIMQYFLAPIKAVISLVKGEFRQAMDDLSSGMDVVSNFQAGAAKGRAVNQKDREIDRLGNDIKQLDRQIQLDDARGLDTRIKERRKSGYEIKKAELEGKSEAATEARHQQQVTENKWAKEDADKAKAEAEKRKQEAKAAAEKAKQAREQREAFEAEIKKSIYDLNAVYISARDKELDDWKFKYEAKLKEAKKHGTDLKLVEEENQLQIVKINKKYDNLANEALKKVEEDEKGSFDKRRAENEKYWNGILATIDLANKELREKLTAARNAINDKINAEEELQKKQLESEIKTKQTGLDVSKLEEEASKEREFRVSKELEIIDAITKAKVEAEDAAFQEELLKLGSNQFQKELLEKEHQFRLTQINNQAAKDRDAIKKQEIVQAVSGADQISSALNDVSSTLEEGTLGQKSLAIASATMSMFTSIVKTWEGYASMGPWGIAGAVAQSAAIAALGISNIKKIAAIKINGKAGNSTVPNLDQANFANATAPIVNAAQAQGNNEVRITNPDDMIFRAYITEGDLDDASKRKSFLDSLSGF